MIASPAAIFAGLLAFALLGGWLSRMCGGGPPKLPWGLDQWLYALPYMAISFLPSLAIISALYIADPGAKPRYKLAFLLALAPYMGAFLGKRTGHGGGMDLGHSTKVRDDEALEFIIKPLHGKIPEYWYDALLLTITGIATTLLASVFVAFINPAAGLILFISGAMKAPAYMIGRAIYPKGRGRGIPYLNEATAIGEFLTGVFAYAGLGKAAVMVFITVFK